MSTITLAAIEAAHKKVSDMIATFKTQAKRILTIAQAEIGLADGEHYAGIVLDASGQPAYHLILLDGDANNVTWEEAKKAAAQFGGELPTRREQALLYANLKGHFDERCYWSCEQHAANDDCAWGQNFVNGGQSISYKSAKLRARAVRRLTIQ
jgi:hypothetical protein